MLLLSAQHTAPPFLYLLPLSLSLAFRVFFSPMCTSYRMSLVQSQFMGVELFLFKGFLTEENERIEHKQKKIRNCVLAYKVN